MKERYKLYIDGEFCEALDGRNIGVRDPALGEEFARVPYGSRAEARRAVEAAQAALPGWSEKTVYERAVSLRRAGELIRERTEVIATTLTREVGKPLAESRGEVMAAASYFDWFAEEAKRYFGEWIPSHMANKRLLTLRMPVGVVAGIGPWNFPVLLLARKIAPALAAGCTIVARPASQTPCAVMEMFACLHEAGFPRGAVNLVTGPPQEMADEFMENPAVRKISFTGSVAVGKELMARAAASLKKLSLELGGHAPFIVCPDAAVEEAAALAVAGKFRNMGQVCISPSRFFVPADKVEAFTEEAAKRASALRLGHGLDPDTDVGPLIDELRVASTQALVADIREKGGRIVCGGKRPQGKRYENGSFFEPTVASGITNEMLIMKEEPFAPILPVIPYQNLDQAIAMANDTPFGLAAYIVTHDLGTAFKLGEKIEAGVIGINDFAPAAAQCPFGGMKESGLGREGWRQGLDAYTEVKYLSIVL